MQVFIYLPVHLTPKKYGHTGNNVQSRIRRLLGFCPPLPKGVGLLSQPHGGVLPYRRPITSVMGAPIRVERVEQPSEEQARSSSSPAVVVWYFSLILNIFWNYFIKKWWNRSCLNLSVGLLEKTTDIANVIKNR